MVAEPADREERARHLDAVGVNRLAGSGHAVRWGLAAGMAPMSCTG